MRQVKVMYFLGDIIFLLILSSIVGCYLLFVNRSCKRLEVNTTRFIPLVA